MNDYTDPAHEPTTDLLSAVGPDKPLEPLRAVAADAPAQGPKLTPGRLKVIDNHLRRALEGIVHAQELIDEMLVGKESTDSPYLIALRNLGIKLDPAGGVTMEVKADLIDLSKTISSAL